MSIEIVQIQPDELDRYWFDIERHLIAFCRDHKVDWKPMHVYVGVYSGATKLFLAKDDEKIRAFCAGIVQQIVPTSKAEFFIWILARMDGEGMITEPAYVKQAIDFLTAYAKGLGLSRITMLSPYKAFERWGFKPIQTVYQLEI